MLLGGATRFENCGLDLAKRKQSDAELAGNTIIRMVIIDTVVNTLFGGLTLDPAGMHCPSWDDAFVSSCPCVRMCLFDFSILVTAPYTVLLYMRYHFLFLAFYVYLLSLFLLRYGPLA